MSQENIDNTTVNNIEQDAADSDDNSQFVDANEGTGAQQVNAVFGKMPFPKFNPRHNVESWFLKVDAWFEFHGVGIRKERQK